MPLAGYMKTNDPGRISSISDYPGDRTRRKKIKPIEYTSNDSAISMYVMDCDSHGSPEKPGGVIVDVMLKTLVPGVGWKDLGLAKCCPLCWRVIKPPKDVVLPEPDLQLIELAGPPLKRVSLPRRHIRTKDTDKPISYIKSQQILKFLRPLASADIYEIMGPVGLSRSTTIKYLNQLIKLKKVVAERSLGGRGNRTVYTWKAP